MDALLFAAGLGTRLRPLTDDRPKALVEVAGRTLLEHNLRRLAEAGVTRVVVNVCHHAEQIERALAARPPGLEVVLSREPGAPLETGGGLLHARDLLRPRAPFFLHNVDVLSDVPLSDIHAEHVASDALVTLVVMERPTRRRLLFDDHGLLGRVDEEAGVDLRVRAPRGPVASLGFAGIHVASPALLGRITETGRFSILDLYLRLAAAGERLRPQRADGCRWIDVGRPADLARAQALFAPGGPRSA